MMRGGWLTRAPSLDLAGSQTEGGLASRKAGGVGEQWRVHVLVIKRAYLPNTGDLPRAPAPGRDRRVRLKSSRFEKFAAKRPLLQSLAARAPAVLSRLKLSMLRFNAAKARCVEAASPKALNRAIQHMLERAA
jgi:hypothetical protein